MSKHLQKPLPTQDSWLNVPLLACRTAEKKVNVGALSKKTAAKLESAREQEQRPVQRM